MAEMEATFCFVDLAGFSALTEAHGDNAAADLALGFSRMAREELPDDGRLIKTIGDAVLVCVAEPRGAAEFIRRLWVRAAGEADFPVVRAGLHHGEAVERGGEVFGAAVNLAARITAQAGGAQVLATQRVADAARTVGVRVTELGELRLRNIGRPVRVFSLALVGDSSSEVVDPVCRMRVSPNTAPARLRFNGTEYWFCSLECAPEL